MESLDVKKILADHLEWLQWALQLQDWSITTAVESLDGRRAESLWQPNYMRCHIVLDPGEFDTEEEALGSLLHELLHGLVAQQIVFRNTVYEELIQRAKKQAKRKDTLPTKSS